ncbi:hypothetical protein BTVI_11679 [Pitangus sulphuratus]|nr:hypothetical protein BTVI_11679 [Pitangus sulphuratus]
MVKFSLPDSWFFLQNLGPCVCVELHTPNEIPLEGSQVHGCHALGSTKVSWDWEHKVEYNHQNAVVSVSLSLLRIIQDKMKMVGQKITLELITMHETGFVKPVLCCHLTGRVKEQYPKIQGGSAQVILGSVKMEDAVPCDTSVGDVRNLGFFVWICHGSPVAFQELCSVLQDPWPPERRSTHDSRDCDPSATPCAHGQDGTIAQAPTSDQLIIPNKRCVIPIIYVSLQPKYLDLVLLKAIPRSPIIAYKKSLSSFFVDLLGTGKLYKVSLEPSLLQAEHPHLSQPVFIEEVLQSSDYCSGPPVDSL